MRFGSSTAPFCVYDEKNVVAIGLPPHAPSVLFRNVPTCEMAEAPGMFMATIRALMPLMSSARADQCNLAVENRHTGTQRQNGQDHAFAALSHETPSVHKFVRFRARRGVPIILTIIPPQYDVVHSPTKNLCSRPPEPRAGGPPISSWRACGSHERKRRALALIGPVRLGRDLLLGRTPLLDMGDHEPASNQHVDVGREGPMLLMTPWTS